MVGHFFKVIIDTENTPNDDKQHHAYLKGQFPIGTRQYDRRVDLYVDESDEPRNRPTNRRAQDHGMKHQDTYAYYVHVSVCRAPVSRLRWAWCIFARNVFTVSANSFCTLMPAV